MSKDSTIYLIDDDTTYQFISSKLLKNSGHEGEIKVFNHGREALQFIQSVIHLNEELPDVILLDLKMPVMDGWDFLDEFNLIQPILKKKITLYVVTSSIDPNDVIKARAYKTVKDFVVKPVNKNKFQQLIQQVS